MGDIDIYVGSAKAAELRRLLGATVEGMGFDLAGIEHVSRPRRALVRIFIEPLDAPESYRAAETAADSAATGVDEDGKAYSQGGVTVDDCGSVSRQVAAMLDVHDPIAGEYDLEVSSPGMDRLLFEPRQFERFVGALVAVKTHSPIAGRRQFKGRLETLEGENVTVREESISRAEKRSQRHKEREEAATAGEGSAPIPQRHTINLRAISSARVVPEW